MKREHKTILVMALAVTGVCGVGLMVLAVWWFKETISRGITAADDGTAFALHHDADQCVDEGLRRLYRAGVGNEVAMRLFLVNCLADAPRSPSFCADVPAKGELMKAVVFGFKFCAKRGHVADERCGRAFAEVLPEACSAPPRSPPPAPPAP